MEMYLVKREFDKNDPLSYLKFLNPFLPKKLAKEITMTAENDCFGGSAVPLLGLFHISSSKIRSAMLSICKMYGIDYDVPIFPGTAVIMQDFSNYVIDALEKSAEAQRASTYTFCCPVCGEALNSFNDKCPVCGTRGNEA